MWELTGLNPDTRYKVSISAVSNDNQQSEDVVIAFQTGKSFSDFTYLTSNRWGLELVDL